MLYAAQMLHGTCTCSSTVGKYIVLKWCLPHQKCHVAPACNLSRELYTNFDVGYSMYADVDFECLRSFDPLFRHYTKNIVALPGLPKSGSSCQNASLTSCMRHAFFGRMGPDPTFTHSIPNAWMASSPGHLFFIFLLQSIMKRMENPKYQELSPEALTGPVALYEAIRTYSKEACKESAIDQDCVVSLRADLYEDHEGVNHVIHILRKEMIYPYSWADDGVEFRNVCSSAIASFDAEECKKRLAVQAQQSYSVTYWSHSWGSEEG